MLEFVVMVQRFVCADWIKVLGFEVRICLSNCEWYDVLDSSHVMGVGCINISQPSDDNWISDDC